MATVVGVISDTHGLMRPEALAALAGVETILHAGDIGAPEILEALRGIAPVIAVRGNNDTAGWAREVPETAVVEVEGVRIYVVHDRNGMEVDVRAEGIAAVVAGHSHRPANGVEGGVLYFNPGSAGPRRFKLPVAVGRLYVEGADVRGEIVVLG